MSELNFNCPLCHEAVIADAEYAGQEIQCPLCAGQIVVPAPSPFKKPGALRVSAEQTHQTAPMPVTPDYVPPPPPPSRVPMMIVKMLVGIVVVAAGLYFGWPQIKKMQAKFTSSTDENAKSGGGGQIGHIGELNAVMDATDPKHVATTPSVTAPQPGAPATNAPSTEIVPPVYTIEVDSAVIPKGMVNGVIAKENFLADTVTFDFLNGAYVLNLRQGTNKISSREIFVFLRLKKDEKIEGGAWVISKYVRTGGPQILKKWQAHPPTITQKSFATGYALKLELGEIKEGMLPGKIYLALPEEDQTVIGGNFVAKTRVASSKTVIPTPAP